MGYSSEEDYITGLQRQQQTRQKTLSPIAPKQPKKKKNNINFVSQLRDYFSNQGS
jgi:hypothetical protein